MGLSLSFLDKPVTDKVTSDQRNDTLKIGVCSMQGWRCSQEDAHNCILDYDENTSLFAVFDGHGGHEVATYCSRKLPQYIKETEGYRSDDLEKALVEAYLGFDALIKSPEVVEELKLIPDPSARESDSDSDADSEEDVSNLYEEASMPIEEVIKKYKSHLKHEKKPKSDDVCDSKAQSVDLPADEHLEKKENLENGNISAEDQNEEDSNKDKGSLKANGHESEQNAEKEETEIRELSQKNGEISKKDDKETAAKTKDVPESSPDTASHIKNAKQLYKKLLMDFNFELESDSEDEEDEEDSTFEEQNGSSEEDDQVMPEQESLNENAEEEGEEDNEDDSDDEDDSKLKMQDQPGWESGCTAVVAILRGNQLYVANAGDSRCIVCRDGKAVEMSLDHTASDDREQGRISKAGGHIDSEGRVNGGLNLTRAIGDHSYKQNKKLSDREQMITALPDVRTLTISSNQDEFMVLACDGVWDCFSNQEVVDFVKSRLEKNPEKLSQIFEEMFDQSLSSNLLFGGPGTDNMTAIIVQFKGSLSKRSAPADDSEEPKNAKCVKTEDTRSELNGTA